MKLMYHLQMFLGFFKEQKHIFYSSENIHLSDMRCYAANFVSIYWEDSVTRFFFHARVGHWRLIKFTKQNRLAVLKYTRLERLYHFPCAFKSAQISEKKGKQMI